MAVPKVSKVPSVPQSQQPPEHFEAEPWNATSAAYAQGPGASTARSAPQVISLAHDLLPLDGASTLAVEFGAGTGSLTLALATRFPDTPLIATDVSPAMIDELKANIAPLKSNVTTHIVDMRSPQDTLAEPLSRIDGPGEDNARQPSHIFCSMALQNLPQPGDAVRRWVDMLRPGGVLAIAVWEFELPCGPHAIWEETAMAVDPDFVNPPILEESRWMGARELKAGVTEAGLTDVYAEDYAVGFNVGTEGFMKYFWESQNPMIDDRMSAWKKGSVEDLRTEMRRILVDKYNDGKDIPLSIGIVVGKKPA